MIVSFFFGRRVIKKNIFFLGGSLIYIIKTNS